MKRTFVAVMASLMLNISFPLHAQDVQVGDISDGKAALIGRLGKAVGTVVTVEGQLLSDPKLANGHITAALRVNKVDGQQLKSGQIIGLEFRASQRVPALRANQLVKFSGFEGVAYIGTPAAAREAMGSDASPLDWKLQSVAHVLKLF